MSVPYMGLSPQYTYFLTFNDYILKLNVVQDILEHISDYTSNKPNM